ncbi:MAG: YraN family protein [Bdellovibrionota bacterium]
MSQTSRQKTGTWAEELAEKFLQKAGYKTVARNYRCKTGEVDLIVEKNGALVFVEVRARENEDYGNPIESLTPAKQRRIARAAQYYLASEWKKGEPEEMRFDFIGIVFGESDEPQIEHVENAFDLPRGMW